MAEHEETMAPALSEDEFRIIRDFIYRRSGIYFHDSKRSFLETKLRRRLAELGAATFSQYFMHIQQFMDDRETVEIFNRITTLETCFYRNRPQMDVLAREVLPELGETKRRVGSHAVRVWSAGCSTGEEAYTLAMALLEHQSCFPEGTTLEVVGSDINTDALARAREGRYPASRVRSLPEDLKQRYLVPDGDDFRVVDELKERVTFQFFNLANGTRFLSLGKMDIVFCRNVLMYFGDAVRRRVLSAIRRTLRDTGYFFAGVTEDISSISGQFVPVHREGLTVCYRPAGEPADARDLVRGGTGGRH